MRRSASRRKSATFAGKGLSSSGSGTSTSGMALGYQSKRQVDVEKMRWTRQDVAFGESLPILRGGGQPFAAVANRHGGVGLTPNAGFYRRYRDNSSAGGVDDEITLA